MSRHPIFDRLPPEYHDRVTVSPDGAAATIDVQDDDTKTVPVVNDWHRDRMGLDRAGHPARREDPWYPAEPQP